MNQPSNTYSTLPGEDPEMPLLPLNNINQNNPIPENELLVAVQSNDRVNLDRLFNLHKNLNLSNLTNQRGFTLLHFACFNNSLDMVQSILHYFEQSNNGELVQFLNMSTNEGFTALHFASYRGNLGILDLLFQKGANVNVQNSQGMNIMHIGAQGDQPNSIVFAHDKGILIESVDSDGGSPLHWACYYGQEQATHYLISLIDRGNLDRMLNLRDSHDQGMLVKYVAPLHLAVISGNTKLVKKLIISGANKHLKGKNGKTPSDLALDNDFKNIHQLLNKKRNFLIAYYNIKQGIKKMRKNMLELIKFLGLMLIQMVSYYFYVCEENPSIADMCIFGVTLLLFLIVTFLNPGYQRRRREPLLQLIHAHEAQDICPTCNLVKLPRSRHCEICQRCVLVYDHHCPWINNCVGAGNHIVFMIFVIMLNVALIYMLVMTGIELGNDDYSSEHTFFREYWVQIIFLVCNFSIGILFTLGVSLLIFTQLSNIFMGMTTFERFAIKTNSSTMGSMMKRNNSIPSGKTSLLENEVQNEPPKKRFHKYSCKNFGSFLKNYRIYRQKEKAIKIS